MKTNRMTLAALAVASAVTFLVAAAPASAQETRVYRVLPRGLLGVLTEPVPAHDFDARQRLIVEVVEDSPAKRAGVMKGDTLIRINGLAATRQVMSAPFEPGDTVVLRVRRDGGERDITLVAAERTDRFEYLTARTLPDSVMMRVNGIMDAVRAGVDTVAIRAVFRRMQDDSLFVHGFGDDSMFFRRFTATRPMMDPEHLDSLRRHIEGARMHLDDFAIRGMVDSTLFNLRDNVHVFQFADSVLGAGPTRIFVDGLTAGRRAVAGAELSELNDGLAAYFGTTSGVLVLEARPGTPAAAAGLQAGDVILSAGGTPVGSIAELRRALRNHGSGEDATVELRVQRHGQERVVRLGGGE